MGGGNRGVVRYRKGFLGNAGSYFFSYVLVSTHLTLPIQSPNIFSRLALTSLCFLIPLADSVVVVATRILTMRSPFQPDKGHLHHRFVQTSIALRWILLSLGLIELAALGLAIFIMQSPGLFSAALSVYLCVCQVSVAAILILLIEKTSRRRLRGYLEDLDQGNSIYYLKYRLKPGAVHVSKNLLRKLEAKIGAEIRVSDVCFAIQPDCLLITLRSPTEPLRRVQERIEFIFKQESLEQHEMVDKGEFLKLSSSSSQKLAA